jgi:transposase
VISMDQFRKVKKLGCKGNSQSEIARELGLNRKTVAKYLKQKDPPKYKARCQPTRQSPISGFEKQIELALERAPNLSAAEVYEHITESGYQGSERTVQRYFNKLDSSRSKERFFEQVYEPAEQAQFDFKECIKIPFSNGVKTVHLHFSTLPFSDAFFIRAYPQRTYECYMDGIHEFFESLGGQPRAIRIDNLAPCVKKVLKGSERLYTKAFEQAIAHYEFEVLPCSPGKGNEKGDVERDIRTFASRILNLIALEDLKFTDFDHLNSWLRGYCEKRWSESTKERLDVEKSHLEALMPRSEEILCRVSEGTVNKYGVVKIVKSQYSVPDSWIGSRVKIVSGPYNVTVTRDKESVLHPRKVEGEHSLDLSHILPSLLRKPQAMLRWSHKQVLFQHKTFATLYDFLKKQKALVSLPEVEFLKVVNLTLSHPFDDVCTAIELCMENPEALFSSQVSGLLTTQHRPPIEQPNLPPIQCNLEQYDQFLKGGTHETQPTHL